LAGQGIGLAGSNGINAPAGFQNAANIQGTVQNAGILGATGLATQAFGRAAQLGSGQAGASILDLLRQQAQPFENRAFNNLQSNLFSTGRIGSTGGGLQTEAFARGLGQADLSRQTQALGLEDQLLSSAFNRFGQTTGLANDLAGAGVQSQAFQSQFPRQLRDQDLQFALQALQGQGGLNSQALANFNAALAAGQAQSNAATGNASNIIDAAGNPAFGGTATTIGNALGGLASRLATCRRMVTTPAGRRAKGITHGRLRRLLRNHPAGHPGAARR
jgi:hypothetical protein